MENAVLSFPTDMLLADLVVATAEHMKMLGYQAITRQRYRSIWRALICFAEERGNTHFSLELGEAFLISKGVPVIDSGQTYSRRHSHLRLTMRVLVEFQMHGCFQRRRSTFKGVCLPEWASACLTKFEHFCTTHLGCSVGTIRVRRHNISSFLTFLYTHGVTDLGQTTGLHICEFMTSRVHLRPTTLAMTATNLRVFLRYLTMQGVVHAPLVESVPKIRVYRDEHIPDVWTPKEVDALLAAVDRASPIGKRDFAILLLAARLGMRAGDIRDLRIEDLRWDEGCIKRIQSKTGTPLVLPMTNEVGEAIIDYLRNGRPPCQYREVFLRAHAPFAPFGRNNSLYCIITTYRKRAGITLPGRSRKGLHSLRHTVATRLLEADTPFPVISSIMGHLSSESTRIYAKVDVETLRKVALDLQEDVDHG